MSVIRRNIFWLLLSQAATWIATFTALLVVPNKLGSTDFGTLGFATGYVQFFTLIAGLGTSVYLSRAVARDHSVLGPYVWNAVLGKVVLWALLSSIALGLAYALGNRGETLAIIAISCAGMLPAILSEVFVGALAGMQRMAGPAMWMVAQVYFQTVFGIVVLLMGWGVVAYATVLAAGGLIPLAATGLMVRPLLRGHRVFDLKIWRLLVVGGVPLVALAFLNLIYGSVDVPILHSMVGSDPVGWYGLALKWAGIPVFITTAVVSAYFPAFSRHGNPLTPEFSVLVNKALHIVLVVMIPASVGLALLASDMVHLFYDDGYDSAIVLIQMLAIGMPIMGMDTVLATALVASDRLNRYLWVAAVATVMNPILCVAAISFADAHFDNGAIGAAAVTLITELWVMIGALRLRAPGVVSRHVVARIARITAAAAAMVPVLLLAGGLPLAAKVPLGAITYGVAALLFGAISADEVQDVVRQFRDSRRGGPPAGGEVDPTREAEAEAEAEVGLTPRPSANEMPPVP